MLRLCSLAHKLLMLMFMLVLFSCAYAYVERVTSENCTKKIRGFVLLYVSAYAYVYVVAVFICACAYALVSTGL